MKKLITIILGLAFLLTLSSNANAQDNQEVKKDSGYVFTVIKQLPASPVKNQYRSGTCWSFSTISFIESELLRMGKDTFDLSDMYCVRKSYEDKAKLHVRYHGTNNFAGGGAFHDVTDVIKNYGMLPEEVYSGKVIGEKDHVHGEMDEVLKAYLEGVIKNENKKLTPVWMKGYQGILDAYLGEVPEKFTYKGKEYTPRSFADMLGVNPDDYVEIASFTHHPFYSQFVIELPDNWSHGMVYNVPLNEMIEVIDNAINTGYTVAWGADVSEKGFSWKNGVAIVPEKNIAELSNLESALQQRKGQATLYL